MSVKDKKIIKNLWKQGFIVMLESFDGKTFNDRYSVFQGCSRRQMKVVVVDEKGNLLTLQG